MERWTYGRVDEQSACLYIQTILLTGFSCQNVSTVCMYEHHGWIVHFVVAGCRSFGRLAEWLHVEGLFFADGLAGKLAMLRCHCNW